MKPWDYSHGNETICRWQVTHQLVLQMFLCALWRWLFGSALVLSRGRVQWTCSLCWVDPGCQRWMTNAEWWLGNMFFRFLTTCSSVSLRHFQITVLSSSGMETYCFQDVSAATFVMAMRRAEKEKWDFFSYWKCTYQLVSTMRDCVCHEKCCYFMFKIHTWYNF